MILGLTRSGVIFFSPGMNSQNILLQQMDAENYQTLTRCSIPTFMYQRT